MSEALNKLKSREDEWDAKILSNLILMNRVYRPDEWTMDDFARMALVLEDRAEKAEAQVDQLLRFINGIGMSDQLKAFCVKENSK